MTAAPTKITIRIAGQDPAHLLLAPGNYIIGSAPDADLHINNDRISHQHAHLTISPDAWSIADLDSTNGTQLDDQPVGPDPTPVLSTNLIHIGEATLQLRQPGSDFDPASSMLPTIEGTPTTPKEPTAPTHNTVSKHLPPELLGLQRYDIGGKVAQGGMGAILSVADQGIRREVAMKVMLSNMDPAQVLRFIEEAQVTGQLEHPNIVPIYELSVNANGEVFYTMKMVRGVTLMEVLSKLAAGDPATAENYALPVLLTVFQKVCDAIAFAHSKGVIHRDLKPENIMLGDYGEVLVLDWGLARISGSNHNPTVLLTARADEGDAMRTLSGSIMGTPAYMSPEQARGEIESLDARSDIYSLGTILFEILHLRPALTGSDTKEIINKAQRAEIEWTATKPATKKTQPQIPESLQAVCRKSLAPNIPDRYPKVEALQSDIRAYQNGFATTAENANLARHLTLALRRHKAVTIATATALAVIIAGATVFTLRLIDEKRQTENALTDLSAKAPALLQLANADAANQQFESALENADTAIALDPAYLPAYWRRAWLLIGMGRWSDAVEAIRLARNLDPPNQQLAEILPIIEQLAQAPDDAERWNAARSEPLLAHLKAVGAHGEIVKLSNVLLQNAKDRVQVIELRLTEWLGKDAGFKVISDRDGSISVSLGPCGKSVTTLEPLRNQPIDHLSIPGTAVTNLEPLRGMSLRSLNAWGLMIPDLSPLRGMPLRELNIPGNKSGLLDFEHLRGAPLEKLIIDNCRPINLSAIRGAPLKYLAMQGTGVADLTFLTDSPIEHLHAYVNPISNIEPLRGKPLRYLCLLDTSVRDIEPLSGAPIDTLELPLHTRLQDYAPLFDLPKLRSIVVGSAARFFPQLRQHPTLESINRRPAAEFWAEFDAQHPTPR